MTAPDLSPAQLATVARFDAAEAAPESLRERVARRIYDNDMAAEDDLWHDDLWFSELPEDMQEHYRVLADAAIAVIRGEAS